MPRRKKYKDYQDYLNSEKWKQVKEEFYDNYEGFSNVCEISGCIVSKDSSDNKKMNLHHWNYETDWNDDNPGNLILVCNNVHDWLHSLRQNGDSSDSPHTKFSTEARKKYLCEAIALWILEVNDTYEYEHKEIVAENKDLRSTLSVLEFKKSIYQLRYEMTRKKLFKFETELIEQSPVNAQKLFGKDLL